MKNFLGAGLLLLLFITLSLSFCLLQISIHDNPYGPSVSVYYQSDASPAVGRLHVTLSSHIRELAREIARSVKEAAEALPFYAVDLAEGIAKEVKEVFSLLGEALSEEQSDGALFV